jgi:shikimate 5-dehydrogenase
MLKQLQEDCKCKVHVTSGTRAKSDTPQGTHGAGKRVVDLRYSPELTSFLKTKGSGCTVTYKGIGFLDEKICPSGNATAPHWHLNGSGWNCGK